MSLEIHPSLLKRKIIHVDMDAFYASVEMRDNPELKGLPVVVGGSPDSRGVVATASYEARKFGIRSAMPASHAYRLCPQAVFVRPRFEAYRRVAESIREIFRRYTDLIEPLSLDEAYLDVTSHALFATEIALRIRQEIFDELHLTASAGVAPNKMVAKIASDIRKPNGQAVIKPHAVFDFMQSMPVKKIPGIGPVTDRRLAAIGIVKCSDVLRLGEAWVIEQLGERTGRWLMERSQGIDDRPVESSRERKSYGRETTFGKDILSFEDKVKALESLAESIAAGLQKRGIAGRTVTVKIKSASFVIQTKAQTVAGPVSRADEILSVAVSLLEKSDLARSAVRLLGISISNLE